MTMGGGGAWVVGGSSGGGRAAPITAPPPDPSVLLQRAMQSAEQLFRANQYQAARPFYIEAVCYGPQHAPAHMGLALCEQALGDRDSARQHMQAAIRYDPKMAFAHSALGHWYMTEGMIDAALEFSGRAMALEPQHAGIQAARAFVLQVAGESAASWDIVQGLIRRGFTPPIVAVLYARMARRHHHEEQALTLLKQVFEAGMRSQILDLTDQAALMFSAADMLDGLKRYDEAFGVASRANTIAAKPYSPREVKLDVDRMIAYFTRKRLQCLPKASYRSERPVFIVGMPRSGTSLVEQVLASHPEVFGAGELDFVNRVFRGTLDMLNKAKLSDYPDCLDSLSVHKADGMAQIYLEPLALMNRDAARVTDKLPLNFLHLGLIASLLPGARVIHCVRDPMDTCLSCYMTDLVIGHEFKFDLRNLGHFYRQYERLMNHWKQVLDLPILDVQYEQLVDDAEGQARRMIEFIGLPWDERCLEFHKTRRSVATASTEQVRQPMYRTSVQRWRNYEKHLGPLREALEAGE
jgi:tetratricopeptide (TPR) repeat protein